VPTADIAFAAFAGIAEARNALEFPSQRTTLRHDADVRIVTDWGSAMRALRNFVSVSPLLMVAVLATGCNSGQRVDLPAADVSAFADIDAIVVQSNYRGRFSTPRGIVFNRGQGAALAMKSIVSGSEAMVVLLLPLAALIGAAGANSSEKISAAYWTFNNIANDPAALASLGDRVASRLSAEAPERWSCVDAVPAADHASCPEASRPASLIINTRFSSATEGRFSPKIRLTAVVDASLERPGAEPLVMRWRYDSKPLDYFRVTQDRGEALWAVIGSMLDELATAVARDLLLDPRPVSMEVWRGGPEWSGPWIESVRKGVPMGVPAGVARRMVPGEPLRFALAPVKASVAPTPVDHPVLDACLTALTVRKSFAAAPAACRGYDPG